MAIKYRPEIDGLRTIAVLSVIVYHAEFVLAGHSVFPGGFFGVDIFFVISGYLITSLIMSELLDSGQFSLLNFYERRVRRLLPALLVVMLASIVAAWNILLPAQLVDFSKSLIASLFFVSNFYWDFTLQEYGAESALLKPFLHTWSLAVEEQYYLVFPLLVLATNKWWRERLTLLLLAGMLASFVFAVWFTSVNAASSFYQLPSRFWELLAGALLASIQYRYPPKGNIALLNYFMPAMGLLLIVYSFAFMEYDSNHPGLITLIPVVGTAAIIWFSGEGDLITKLLASRGFVAIGLISYGLYLWHFPIFAFARNIGADISVYEKLVWILLTFILSILSYFLVEKPFRNRKKISAKNLLIIVSVTSLVVIVFSTYAIYNDGVRARLAELEILYEKNEFDNTILDMKAWSILRGLPSEKGFVDPSTSVHDRPSKFESTTLWFSSDAKKQKVLIIGDSMSRDLFNAFYQNAEKFPAHEFARFGMSNTLYEDQLSSLMQSPNYVHADIIIVRFTIWENLERFGLFIERLKQSGKHVYMSSNPPIFGKKGESPLFDSYLRKYRNTDGSDQRVRELFYEHRNLSSEEVDFKLRKIAQNLDTPFLNFWDLVCNSREKTCDGVTPQGYKSFFDQMHWTLEGAKHFGGRIYELGWMEVQ